MNHVDRKAWIGSLKFAILSIKVGGWSKKSKIISTWLLNAPSVKLNSFLQSVRNFKCSKKLVLKKVLTKK